MSFVLPVAALVLAGCQESSLPTEPGLRGEIDPEAAAFKAQSVSADDWIVVFRPGTDDAPGLARKLAAEHGGSVRFTYETVLQGFAGRIPAQAIEGIRRNPNVFFVEQDGVATKSQVASWGLDRIDQRNLPLDNSFAPGGTGAGVDAWIIDSGIDFGRSDEFGSRLDDTRDRDFVDGDFDASDCEGHGTHVAGTVGSSTFGVAKGVTLIGVRVLGCTGSGSYSGVIAGIDYVAATASGPTVANMSLGGPSSSAVNLAVANAVASGVTMVVAAGNDGQDACTKSPASAPEAITVAASMSNDARSNHPGWWSSNYGSCVDLFAPGSDISSTVMGGGSESWYGTSMASPHVAGAAALLLGSNPGWTPAQVWSAMQSDATSGVLSDVRGSPDLLLHVGSGGTPPPPPPECTENCDALVQWVSQVSVSTRNGNRSRGTVTVQVVDANGPVAGATVTGRWTADGTQESGTTGTDGMVEFRTGWLRNVSTWELCVLSVAASGLGDGSSGECSPHGEPWPDGGGGDPPPPPDPGADAPADLSVSTVLKGRNYRAELSWTGGAATVDIERNGSVVATVSNSGSYTDNLGKTPASVSYRACNAGTNDCTGSVDASF
ncbi:MAG: S8 family serine peptidase [marine benthic group bacterium]|jgi:subtilisin family serine protease|nr:S8 family serine peptidase [Gemmatimonadota bacterium]MCL7980208.1 S8 family serine peptidase [Gemmatimonadota bacterium]